MEILSNPAQSPARTGIGPAAAADDIDIDNLNLPEGICAHQHPVQPTQESFIAFQVGRAIALPDSLRQAVLKRKVEYLAGRYCLRRALRNAGYDGNGALPGNPDRSLAWPEGWRGSLSHCTDIAAAIAARAQYFAGLGLDIENIQDEESLLNIGAGVVREEEWPLLRRLGADDSLCITLAFSLKESLYKALWPDRQEGLEFHDACLVDLCPDTRRFRVELRTARTRFDGAYLIGYRHVLSAVWIPGYAADTFCDPADKLADR